MLDRKIKVLHIADIHLGRDFNLKTDKRDESQIRKEEIWDSFEKIIEYGQDQGAELVLIAGDLYENDSISKSNLDRLAFIFSKFPGLRFYISLGNHDYISLKSEYLEKICPKNVFIFSNSLSFKEYKHVRIYGYSWDKVEYRENPINFLDLDPSYVNILLLHGMDASMSTYLPLDIEDLESYGFDYIALGHIHQPKKLGRVTYYSGSVEPLSFNNLGPHGGLFLDFVGKEVHVDFIKMAKRSYYDLDLDLSDLVDNRDLFEKARDLLRPVKKTDIIRLKLLGRKSKKLDLNELEILLSRDYKLLYLVDQSSPKLNFNKILEDNKDNIIGKYFAYVFNNFQEKEQRQLVQIGIQGFSLGDKYED